MPSAVSPAAIFDFYNRITVPESKPFPAESIGLVSERWCPGNGTAYDLTLAGRIDGGGLVLFTWTNAPGCGRAALLPVDGTPDGGYLMEKMELESSVDAAAILQWLARHGIVAAA